ncbi:hypothetical protein UC3_01909 [Enterococcus phoeniculicola ATCC BAA-412]|jgi:hypothetical protein|uniref:Uncharacterized protein n=1 Tax=Enterococcus phoeniculicola ATCC BAA-412 TaxID=1158610 RepID=R3W8Z3_9ENTE|nr:hypothetical protein UC3_01909 [Enterococcus phoeniculicola ATCC BAA-412]EOT76709.1 hypothetical protein I589_01666 [Enterococcus phoeniculicola ATCC BAA-412]
MIDKFIYTQSIISLMLESNFVGKSFSKTIKELRQ